MRNLIYVPIEPLTERYTEQWYRRFPEYFRAAGFNVTVIDGKPLLEDDIKVGAFLDINSTVHYKMSQLMQISAMFNSGKVENNTTFFFGDIEFWGLESVRLMADMNNVGVTLTGFLHAASYTRGDAFEIAAPYQQYTELGWIAALDKVFVGSEYHKRAVLERRLTPGNAEHLLQKIKVTKNPIFLDEYEPYDLPKENKIILSNRLDKEKDPLSTLKLFDQLSTKFPDWKFVVTSGRRTLRGHDEAVAYALDMQKRGILDIKTNLTKAEYHKELATSKFMVSHSQEESYGYCIAEALVYKTVPFLYDGASHPEFVGKELLFNSTNCFDRLSALMTNPPEAPTLDASGMDNIIKELL